MNDTVIDVKKQVSRKLKAPNKYKVIILNDDYTPADFVIALLIKVFRASQDEALRLTVQIHEEGSAVVGVYTHEIAEQKVAESTEISRMNGHPLVTKASQE